MSAQHHVNANKVNKVNKVNKADGTGDADNQDWT